MVCYYFSKQLDVWFSIDVNCKLAKNPIDFNFEDKIWALSRDQNIISGMGSFFKHDFIMLSRSALIKVCFGGILGVGLQRLTDTSVWLFNSIFFN